MKLVLATFSRPGGVVSPAGGRARGGAPPSAHKPSPARLGAALGAAGVVGALLLGCGGNVEIGSSSGGGGSTVTGGGGAGGTTIVGGGGAGGAGPQCEDFSAGSLAMNIVTPDGAVWDCAAFMESATGDLVVEGAVIKAESGMIELDACGPAADCLPMIYQVKVGAPGLALNVPVGAYVRLQARVYIPWGCEQRIMITNLPVWQGTPNPVASDSRLWMAGSEGSAEVLESAPFWLDKIKLACDEIDDMGCGQPAHYAMQFTPAGQPDLAILVAPGETKALALPDTPGAVATNLKSYETGYCDDYWNWGYWVAPAPVK